MGEAPSISLGGVELARITEAQCVDLVTRRCAAGEGGWVVTPNLEILRQCVRDVEIAALVGEAELRVADGMPLIWASRVQGTPLPERVCGSNLILSLSAAAADHALSVYLLGGAEGTAEATAEILARRYPNLKIAGTYYPPYGFEQDEREIERMEQAIASARPDIVFVALGFPKAERLIRRIRTARPGAWWMGVGISFSFVSGHVRRAPKWMQRCGLEWVHRLAQEPRRLIRRYLIDDIPFALTLLAAAFRRRLRQGKAPPAPGSRSDKRAPEETGRDSGVRIRDQKEEEWEKTRGDDAPTN